MALERTGGSHPASGGIAITKNDDTVLDPTTRGIWVGGTGDMKVRMVDQTVITIEAIPAGTLLPIRVDKVLSTGTTATKMVGLY